MISENNKPQGVTMRKYRTVAIPIDVFEELKQIANQEGRSYANQNYFINLIIFILFIS